MSSRHCAIGSSTSWPCADGSNAASATWGRAVRAWLRPGRSFLPVRAVRGAVALRRESNHERHNHVDSNAPGRNARVLIVSANELSTDTTQTPGMIRTVAFDAATAATTARCAFRSVVLPGAATGTHHHGSQETVLYVVTGRTRYRWGATGECRLGRARDFVLIPPTSSIRSSTRPWTSRRCGPSFGRGRARRS